MKEHTVALIKPDAWERGLVGVIINRIEQTNIVIETMVKREFTRELAGRFYGPQYKNEPYLGELLSFISSGPSLVMILSSEDVIQFWRNMMGSAYPYERKFGTIRGDLARGQPMIRNLVHGSDSLASFQHEAMVMGWFPSLFS